MFQSNGLPQSVACHSASKNNFSFCFVCYICVCICMYIHMCLGIELVKYLLLLYDGYYLKKFTVIG